MTYIYPHSPALSALTRAAAPSLSLCFSVMCIASTGGMGTVSLRQLLAGAVKTASTPTARSKYAADRSNLGPGRGRHWQGLEGCAKHRWFKVGVQWASLLFFGECAGVRVSQ
jgi:hypothetical protein